MNIDEVEFEKFLEEVLKIGKEYGIKEEALISTLADAIKNREVALGLNQENEE